MVHHSAASHFDLFRTWFGPVTTVLAAVDADQVEPFTWDWIALAEECNVATDGTLEIPARYLEVVAVKRT